MDKVTNALYKRRGFIIKTCDICGKEFEAYNKTHGHPKVKALRKNNAVTCSKKCSKLRGREITKRKRRMYYLKSLSRRASDD